MKPSPSGSPHHEERRCVHRAVVAPEGHLAERGHLAAAHLVQDLAGLCVLHVGTGGRLRVGQECKDPARDLRVRPQQLERGDQSVPSERRAEPRDAGVRIRAARRLGDHHVEIGGGPPEPPVERLAG
jgi:hypothetical protein